MKSTFRQFIFIFMLFLVLQNSVPVTEADAFHEQTRPREQQHDVDSSPVSETMAWWDKLQKVMDDTLSDSDITFAEMQKPGKVHTGTKAYVAEIARGAFSNDLVLPVVLLIILLYFGLAAHYILLSRCGHKAHPHQEKVIHVDEIRGSNQPVQVYLISFVTGLLPGSGTSAEVIFRLRGSLLKTPWVNLTQVAKSIGAYNPCSRGARSKVALWFDGNIQTMQSVEVRICNIGHKSAYWFLKAIHVTDTTTNIQYTAVVNKWIKHEGPFLFRVSSNKYLPGLSILRVSLVRAFQRLFVWSPWKFCTNHTGMSFLASLSLCLLMFFGIMAISSCCLFFGPTYAHNHGVNNHLQAQKITEFAAPKESLSPKHPQASTSGIVQPEPFLLFLALILVPISWFLEWMVRCRRKNKKLVTRRTASSERAKRPKQRNKDPSLSQRKFGPLSKILGMASSHSPSASVSVNDVLMDSMDEETEAMKIIDPGKGKKTSNSPPVIKVSSKTTDLTSEADSNNNTPVRGKQSLREILQNRLQDLLHDTSVYVKMKLSPTPKSSKGNAVSKHSSKWSQASSFWNKSFGSKSNLSKITCALCKGRELIECCTQEHLPCQQATEINAIAQESVKSVLDSLKSGQYSKEHLDILKAPITEKLAKVMQGPFKKSGSMINASLSKSIPVTKKTHSDSLLVMKNKINMLNQPGKNSETNVNCNMAGNSILKSSIALSVGRSVHSSLGKVMSQLSKEINKDEKTKCSRSKERITNTSSQPDIESPNQLPKAAIIDVEQLDSVASATLREASRLDRDLVDSAVDNAVNQFAHGTADQIFSLIIKSLTKWYGSEIRVIPNALGEKNLVREVAELIQKHYTLATNVKEELILQAYAKQYADTVITNTVIKARYELTAGSWIFSQAKQVLRRIKRGCKTVMKRLFIETRINKARLKQVLTNKNFVEKIIKAVMVQAVADLEDQIERQETSEHTCCCELVNKVLTLAMEDDQSLCDTNVVNAISDNLLRKLTEEAAEHVGEDLATVLFEIKELEQIKTISFGGATPDGFIIESCFRDIAQCLIDTKEELFDQASLRALNKMENVSSNNWIINMDGAKYKKDSQNSSGGEESCTINMSAEENNTSAHSCNNSPYVHYWYSPLDSSKTHADVGIDPWLNAIEHSCRPSLKCYAAWSDEELLELAENQENGGLGSHNPLWIQVLFYLICGLLCSLAVTITLLFGLSLSPHMAAVWLIYVTVGLILHMFVFEPVKIALVLIYTSFWSKKIY